MIGLRDLLYKGLLEANGAWVKKHMDLVARQLSVCNNRSSVFPVQCIELILGILSNDCLLVCMFG